MASDSLWGFFRLKWLERIVPFETAANRVQTVCKLARISSQMEIECLPEFVRQLMDPAEFPFGRMPADLLHGDHIPNAGTPMGQEREDEHEEGEDDVAVLRVAIHLLEQTRQAQQSYQFEQIQVDVRERLCFFTGRAFREINAFH